jgi:hypothetical protein
VRSRAVRRRYSEAEPGQFVTTRPDGARYQAVHAVQTRSTTDVLPVFVFGP